MAGLHPPHPEVLARSILKHAIDNGDLVGHDDDGQAVLVLRLPPAALDQLATFDVDGDPDIEAVSEDEGWEERCEDVGVNDNEDGCWAEDDARAWHDLTPPSRYPVKRQQTPRPAREEQHWTPAPTAGRIGPRCTRTAR